MSNPCDKHFPDLVAIPGPTNIHATDETTESHAGPPAHRVHLAEGHGDPSSTSTLDAEDKPDKEEVAGEGGGVGASDASNPFKTRPGAVKHHSVREKMSPHLQFMAGPMLVYHTVANGIWHGACMIVTADAGETPIL